MAKSEKKPEPLPSGFTDAPAPVAAPAPVIEAPQPTPAAGPPKPRRAKVSVPNTHVGSIDVEFSADAPDPRAAAIEAAKTARGIVHFGAAPEVEFLN